MNEGEEDKINEEKEWEMRNELIPLGIGSDEL